MSATKRKEDRGGELCSFDLHPLMDRSNLNVSYKKEGGELCCFSPGGDETEPLLGLPRPQLTKTEEAISAVLQLFISLLL
jgi:hypothetical protein